MKPRSGSRSCLVALAVVAAAGGAGCYRHVVGAKGFGAAEPMKMYEPNAPDEKAKKQRRVPSTRPSPLRVQDP